ncbi:hypothetical protein BJF84_10950 [Rhodococcus sp. CUA-806]|nr:hypothetical protein BJF84_10950 [Rhodococcus sp. CUA-806]
MPVAENTALNTLGIYPLANGRSKIDGNLDKLTTEKLKTALSPLTAPTPSADGTRDPRTPNKRNADGLAELLDRYLNGHHNTGPSSTGPGSTNVKLIVPLTELMKKPPHGPPDENQSGERPGGGGRGNGGGDGNATAVAITAVAEATGLKMAGPLMNPGPVTARVARRHPTTRVGRSTSTGPAPSAATSPNYSPATPTSHRSSSTHTASHSHSDAPSDSPHQPNATLSPSATTAASCADAQRNGAKSTTSRIGRTAARQT